MHVEYSAKDEGNTWKELPFEDSPLSLVPQLIVQISNKLGRVDASWHVLQHS